jgi:hypothetical protein
VQSVDDVIYDAIVVSLQEVRQADSVAGNGTETSKRTGNWLCKNVVECTCRRWARLTSRTSMLNVTVTGWPM